MAYELQVTLALIDTEPDEPGNPGVIIRSERCSTMVPEHDGDGADWLALCEVRVVSITDDVLTDFRGQVQIATENVKREAEGE